MSQTRLVEIRRKVLKSNDLAAGQLRDRFERSGLSVISLVSSPGSGKTAFLERILTLLRPEYRVAALVGDLATDNDAVRLARSQAPVKQISTGSVCHLDAAMVSNALEAWRLEGLSLDDLDFLFIENVGNLVCPSSYDLGEATRLVLLSVTEGEDKPLKYPSIFNTADIAVITKMDMAVAAGFQPDLLHRNIQAVRPGMQVFEVSASSGAGIDAVLDWMRTLRLTTHDVAN